MIPFELDPEIQGEIFEEESERGRSRRAPQIEHPAPVPLIRLDNVQGEARRFRQLARRNHRYESPDQAVFDREGRLA